MKLANPLYYPLSVLAGGVVLFFGVRLGGVSSWVMVPTAVLVSVGGASWRRSIEPEGLALENPALAKELDAVCNSATALAAKATDLRQEAGSLLTEGSMQLELLTAVQYTCDRVEELPQKIDRLSRRFQGSDSLLSVDELQGQVQEVRSKLRSREGVARQQLEQLEASLERNIQLARAGKDARDAQVISLSTAITEAAGTLQALQNKLRTADLHDSEQLQELRSLSQDLQLFQENVDVLVAKPVD
ncbi:MAG: hypothetical protein J7641_13055 [Cyanobacteria bacterium SID2]|nr:hypothetical protein [Cyanobacteria bacterium SID2]MBP0004938.1 hypothetical protein [Cyanobacteria bacterium SBC]